MINIILQTLLAPFYSLVSIFNDDSHKIISQKGREILDQYDCICDANENEDQIIGYCHIHKTDWL